MSADGGIVFCPGICHLCAFSRARTNPAATVSKSLFDTPLLERLARNFFSSAFSFFLSVI
jgi:hypothetical protein